MGFSFLFLPFFTLKAASLDVKTVKHHSFGTQDFFITYRLIHLSPAQDGLTPLHYCARAGHLDVVKLLVEAGASPGDKSIEGKTPIVLAVASEHVDVYNYLINKKHDSYKLLEDKKVRNPRCEF